MDLKRAVAQWIYWRDSAWRRKVNSVGTESDWEAYTFTAVGLTALLIGKTWIREGLPGLAALAGTHSLIAVALACLIRHRRWGRQFYMEHRELFGLAFLLHMQWMVRLTALHGGVNTMDHHGGSALRLLGLLCGHTTVLYCTLYVLYIRPLWPASVLIFATMAATSLWNGERMCHRVLESPGVEAPLSELTALLSLIHTAPMPRLVAEPLASVAANPMQQCKAISAWLVLAAGVALPTALLQKMEKRTLKQVEQQRQRQQAQRNGAGGEEEPHLAAAAGGGGPLFSCNANASAGWGLYLASSTIWVVACGLYCDGQL